MTRYSVSLASLSHTIQEEDRIVLYYEDRIVLLGNQEAYAADGPCCSYRAGTPATGDTWDRGDLYGLC